MPARLVAVDGGPDIVVDRPLVVVGRDVHCDARLDSSRVSRRHCCLAPSDGAVTVRDLGSTNGIKVNGQHVHSGRIWPGDELAIAHLRFRLEGSGAPAPPAAGASTGGDHPPGGPTRGG